MSKWYHETHTVEFNECDLSKTVYNSRYFTWFERARFRIAEEAGLFEFMKSYQSQSGCELMFPVLEAECKFLLPIPLGKNLAIRTKLDKPKAAKLVFHHIVTDLDSGFEYAKAKTVVGVLSPQKGLLLYVDNYFYEIINNYLEN